MTREIETRSQSAAELLTARTDSLTKAIDTRSQSAVDLIAARGEEQHRHIHPLAQPLEQLEAVDVGQADVEDHQRRHLRRRGL